MNKKYGGIITFHNDWPYLGASPPEHTYTTFLAGLCSTVFVLIFVLLCKVFCLFVYLFLSVFSLRLQQFYVHTRINICIESRHTEKNHGRVGCLGGGEDRSGVGEFAVCGFIL